MVARAVDSRESVDRYIVYEENDIYAAVPVAERPDGSYKLLPAGDVPRSLCFLRRPLQVFG